MLKLRDRISKGENRTTEFKREVPVSLKNILKTIIAFANDAGGDKVRRKARRGALN